MQFHLQIKRLVEKFPASLGRPLAFMPFSLRLGSAYFSMYREIRRFEMLPSYQRDALTAERLRQILSYVYDYVPFYRDRYNASGFNPASFRTLADWIRVPVVTKDDMQNASFETRISQTKRSMRTNTGGTSGQPLDFLLDSHAFAREWAHMHHIWMAHGYRPTHLKLTFRGKHFDVSEPLRYNSVHNEFIVNSNCRMDDVAQAVRSLSEHMAIRWLHGYPSLVAEFADVLYHRHGVLANLMRERLFGILLGSEFPAEIYRSKIEEVLSSNIVSWYGHSEMALLARETARGIYTSLPTYGFAEVVPGGGDKSPSHLVCTSFYNRAHPFVRYDTGDLVELVTNHTSSISFKVSEGRVGDFVACCDGRKISLTAAIFGRHHSAFSKIRHLQVRQDAPGAVTLLVVPTQRDVSLEELRPGFDLDDLGIDWRIQLIESPIRSAAGKIRLKVN